MASSRNNPIIETERTRGNKQDRGKTNRDISIINNYLGYLKENYSVLLLECSSYSFFISQQAIVGHGLFSVETSRPHSGAQNLVGFL